MKTHDVVVIPTPTGALIVEPETGSAVTVERETRRVSAWRIAPGALWPILPILAEILRRFWNDIPSQ